MKRDLPLTKAVQSLLDINDSGNDEFGALDSKTLKGKPVRNPKGNCS
jgi:hypothetical protein